MRPTSVPGSPGLDSVALKRVTPARPRFLRQINEDDLVPLLLFIVLGALAGMTLAQNDTWWHLRSGQEMWSTGSVLLTERFSHTSFGAELNNHWWLSQIVFYGVFHAGGSVVLTLLAGGCAFASVFASWRLTRGPLEVRLLLLIFLLLATAPEWAIRPQVISLVLLMVAAHLAVTNRLGWLPVVCVIWANTHALVIFGVVIAVAAAVEALLWSRAHFQRTLVIGLCCAVAPVLSPAAWQYWPQVFRTITLSRSLDLHEYRAPLDAFSIPFWVAVLTLFTLVLVRWNTLGHWRRGERVLLITATILSVSAMAASRNIAFFAVTAAPVLSWLVARSAVSGRRVPRPLGVAGYAMITIALLCASVVVASRWRDGGVRLGWHPLSSGVIEAVRTCPDPIFNHLEDGGYLMWALPTRRVFVDSRMEAYPLQLLQQSREADLYGDYVTLFRTYGIRCAVVRTDSSLRRRLAQDPSMAQLYSDRGRSVFVRTGL